MADGLPIADVFETLDLTHTGSRGRWRKRLRYNAPSVVYESCGVGLWPADLLSQQPVRLAILARQRFRKLYTARGDKIRLDEDLLVSRKSTVVWHPKLGRGYASTGSWKIVRRSRTGLDGLPTQQGRF